MNPWIALAVFFALAMVGGAYGASIDRYAMVIGVIPGMVGLIGLTFCRESIDEWFADSRETRRQYRKAKLSRSIYR
jgi:uncharacterized membrane protein